MKIRSVSFLNVFALIYLVTVPLANAAPTAEPGSIAGNMEGKYDTKLPVEISADNLEVQQIESRATFKGNVIAVQGKIRLKSDKMIVHYKQKDAKAVKPGEPSVAKQSSDTTKDATSGMGAISIIEVEGNVLLATPEESAKGDRGNYQVDEKVLHLSGDNVVLTRGQNILRGTELEYNLESGHSMLTNKGAKVGGTNGGRVRGVFMPNSEEKNESKGSKKPQAIPGDL